MKRKFPISGDGTVAHELITVNDRAPDAHYDHMPDDILSAAGEGNNFVFQCRNGISLRIHWLGESLVRFRYSLDGAFDPDFSYAIDPGFQTAGGLSIQFREDPDTYLLSSRELLCKIEKAGLKVHLADPEGNWICRDKQGFYGRTTILRGKIRLGISKGIEPGDHFYGLGDKPGDHCLNGNAYENWNTDAYSFGAHSDTLYKSVPFFYGIHDNRAFGIFLDNTYRSRFDFGKTGKDELRFETAGGEMNYYFFYGPSLGEVAAQYTRLTGLPELPPVWALGFHQSRWSYFPDHRVLEVAKSFRERRIPCDSIYFDIDYMDGFRCFTWDPVHFPDPKRLLGELKSLGFHPVVMIDPGIKLDQEYWVYRDGMDRRVFCYRGNGDLMTGPVWPQECVFPDFTDPAVREWWGGLYRDLYLDQGVAGFWNDMNEPAVFKTSRLTFPDDVRHQYDGHPTNHGKAHNIYGQQMARATFEGLKKLDQKRRPFILTRASFAGGQRHAATWTGDNMATWDHMKIAHRQVLRLSICGFGFCGSDVGGFMHQPDGEMMLRWLQLGVFHPFYRVHSMGNNLGGASVINPDWVHQQEANHRLDQEPWAFGPVWEELNKKAIEWRYQWLPYVYTAFWRWIKTGDPILKSLVFYDQQDPKLRRNEDGIWIGNDVLAYPVLDPGRKSKTVYLPKGQWSDYWTGKPYSGGRTHRFSLRLDQIPVFVRQGAVIPHHSIRQSTAFPADELVLRVYPGDGGSYSSTLYEDAGDGYGEFSVFSFQCSVGAEGLKLRCDSEGGHSVSYKKLRVKVPGEIYDHAKFSGRNLPVMVSGQGTELILDPFPGQGKNIAFEILFKRAD